MSLKCVICLKKVSEERDLSLDSEGHIGKPVPLTPTLLGVFILNQHLSKNSKGGSLPWKRSLRGGSKS